MNIDHDRLFKELLRTFFLEFLDAFVPEVLKYLDASSIQFLDKEFFTDLAGGDRHRVDLLVKARFKEQDTFFLIHVESQASAQSDFAAPVFFYFARIHEAHRLPVYPIALLSYDSPQRPEPDHYDVQFPDQQILNFRFRTIQLNRLNWREFLRKPNPAIAALMTKMQIAPEDRPRVAVECLRMIATLKLDPARQTLIHSFMDTYLRLSAEEQQVYNRYVESVGEPERKAMMQLVNQWEEHAARRILVRLLTRKFGAIPAAVHDQISNLPQEKLDQLADAVLDFTNLQQLQAWLAQQG